MPVLKDFKKFKTISIISIIISAVYLLASVISLLLVFSYVSGTDQTIAIYSLTRTIEYGRFFQRTDAIFILMWILLVLSYLSIIVVLCLNIFKKISNISNSKAMVYSFSILLFSVCFFSQNVAEREIYT
ncbi:MAG: GerAB/ArcD/ProY family transporter [Clostridia bacterium]|nr:GerAB/ArcD/ProY family transporter [Clostridia bacterium]